MKIANLTVVEVHALNKIAEGLLWLGCDMAADEIYAAIEADAAECDCTGGDWSEVFEG